MASALVAPEIQLANVDGLPCVWEERRGPPAAALVARVGFADETLVTRGITHLVEHAVFPARDLPGISNSGTVGPLLTTLWARDDRERACGFVTECARALAALDPERIRHERSVLCAEEAWRGSGYQVLFAAALRFGSNGHGLGGFREYGTHRVSDEAVVEWARSRFTRGNCVLCIVGEPPDIELPLAEGARIAPPELSPIPYIRYPSVYTWAADGRVSVSLLCERSWSTLAASVALEARLRERLRFRMGSTYAVETSYEPLSGDTAHVFLTADCEEHRVTETRNNVLATLDDFAADGPSEEELDRWRDAVVRDDADPANELVRLIAFARDELDGRPFAPCADLRAEREDVTCEEVRAAFAGAMQSILLLQPEKASSPGGRFDPYPVDSPDPVAGRRYRRRRPRPWRRRPGPEYLVAGDEGVMLHSGQVWGTRFADCAAVVRWSNGLRELYSRDGFHLVVDPQDWDDGVAVTRIIDDGIPEELVVDMEDSEERRPADPEIDEALALDDDEATLDRLGDVVRTHPDSARGWRFLAAIAVDLEWWPRSLAAAERAIELEPGNVTPHCLRLRALSGLSRDDEIPACVDALLEVDPVDLAGLGSAVLGLVSVGEIVRAARLAERAVELYPDRASAWSTYGWARLAESNLDDAAAALMRAIELDPEEPAWHYTLGYVLLGQGRTPAAADRFARAVRLSPDVDSRFALALAMALRGWTAEAADIRRELHCQSLDAVRRLLARDPSDGLTRTRLTVDLRALGRHEEALDEARRAYEAAPDDAAVGANLAVCAVGAGRTDEARSLLRRLAGREDTGYPAVAIEAELAAILGDPVAARHATGRAAQLDGPHARVLVDAYAAAAEQDWAAVERHLAHLVAAAPFNCCVAAWRGLASAGRGDDRAAAEFRDFADRCSDCNCVAKARLADLVAAR